MSVLTKRYSPRWLYLHEFADALRRATSDPTDEEIAEAIALLLRDRLIVDGHLNEREFRFLEGAPVTRSVAWIDSLDASCLDGDNSRLLAGIDRDKHQLPSIGILIEIAASCIDYFKDDQPHAVREPTGQMKREDAVRFLMENGKVPPNSISWNAFCVEVCELADGWINKHNGKTKFGFSPKMIERDVRKFKPSRGV